MSENKAPDASGEERLRGLVESLSNQLCQAVGGRLDVTVRVDTDDETIEKLQMLVNFTLDAARRSLNGMRARNAEFQEAHAYLQAVLDGAGDGIITIDDHGVVQSFNASAQRIFGYSDNEVVGANVSKLMPVSHAEVHDGYIQRYLTSGQAHIVGRQHEVVGRRSDGATFPMELNVQELRLGERLLFIGVARDISERKRLESEMRSQHDELAKALTELQQTHTQLLQGQRLEAIGSLAAGIAHEINTPIQFVGDNTRFLSSAFGDLLRVLDAFEQMADPTQGSVPWEVRRKNVRTLVEELDVGFLHEEVPRAISQTLEGVERVATIVRSMKEFSHPGVDHMTSVDLNRAIESTLTVSRNEWKYVAGVVTEFDEALPLVTCHPGDINQVILNLIVNAAQAIGDVVGRGTDDKGAIFISTHHDGDWAEIRIRDTGTGIPPEIRAKIFNPFFTTKEVGKGTGQGLAIARSVVVEKHGGELDCESEVGQGTTFIIRLPIVPETAEVCGAAT